jgi:hypothetical protein
VKCKESAYSMSDNQATISKAGGIDTRWETQSTRSSDDALSFSVAKQAALNGDKSLFDGVNAVGPNETSSNVSGPSSFCAPSGGDLVMMDNRINDYSTVVKDYSTTTNNVTNNNYNHDPELSKKMDLLLEQRRQDQEDMKVIGKTFVDGLSELNKNMQEGLECLKLQMVETIKKTKDTPS